MHSVKQTYLIRTLSRKKKLQAYLLQVSLYVLHIFPCQYVSDQGQCIRTIQTCATQLRGEHGEFHITVRGLTWCLSYFGIQYFSHVRLKWRLMH